MSDRPGGIGNVGPPLPVRPVDRSSRDRPSGGRKKKPTLPSRKDGPDSDRADEYPGDDKGGTIDEYV